MSTRSCVARVGQNESTFAGRYVHWNGSPSWAGPHLLNLLKRNFKGDLQRMLVELIDEHTVGWSIVGEDCYCHPQNSKRSEFKGRKPETEPFLLTEHNLADSDAEWLYAFDAENRKLFVRDLRAKEDVGIVDLTGKPPSKKVWAQIECGEDFRRCGHYAWFHGLLPKSSNLSTRAWLGIRPLEFHDAVGFVIAGKRYAATGSGGNSDFYNRSRSARFPAGHWIATVKPRNGKAVEFPVAVITGAGRSGYAPADGVSWILPPTKLNPQETIVSA